MKNKTILIKSSVVLSALLLLSACNKSEKEETLISGIEIKNMDTLVKPGDNFDAYVNGTWAKKNKIPADKSSFGAWDVISDKADEDVKAIITEASKGKFDDGSDEQKIGDFYNTYMTQNARLSLHHHRTRTKKDQRERSQKFGAQRSSIHAVLRTGVRPAFKSRINCSRIGFSRSRTSRNALASLG